MFCSPPSKSRLPVLLGLLLFTTPSVMQAATALHWAETGHLLFLSGVIGVVETAILVRFFSANTHRTLVLMLAANYLSAWAALHFLGHIPDTNGSLTLKSAWTWFWGALFLSFLLTLLLEWGFVFLSLPVRSNRVEASFLGTLVIQVSSFLLLGLYYVGPSHFSLYTQAAHVPLADMGADRNAIAYYISPKDGNVYRTALDRVTAEPVYELDDTGIEPQLFLRPHPLKSDHWDLLALLRNSALPGEGHLVEILTDLRGKATLAPVHLRTAARGREPRFESPPPLYGDLPVPRTPSDLPFQWEAFLHFWPGEGIYAHHPERTLRHRTAFATPFGSLAFRHATQLPGNLVLCQIGDELALLDLESRRVARLIEGTSPVVLLRSEG